MKILLVFPPILDDERYGKLARADSYLPPLGLLYLASVLENNHEIKIIENKNNMGKGYSVKRRVSEANDEFIFFTDADLSAPIEGLEKFFGNKKL